MDLTKSDLLAFRQCPKRLWLEKHRPDAGQEERATRRRIQDNQAIEMLAQKALGQDVVRFQLRESVQATAAHAKSRLREHPGCTAVEVPMFHAGLYAQAHALIAQPEGGFALQETIASRFPLRMDRQTVGKAASHLFDSMAIGAWVIEQSGIPLTRAELNMIDERFVYPGNDDYSGFLRALDVTDDIAPLKQNVPIWLTQAQNVAAASSAPRATTGAHCTQPHTCQFKRFCRTGKVPTLRRPKLVTHMERPPSHVPLYIFPDLGGKRLAADLAAQGYTSLTKVPIGKISGSSSKTTALYQRIHKAHLMNQPVVVPAAAEMIDSIDYPRYFLALESVDLVIPRWTGFASGDQATFQWSCHAQGEPEGFFEHHEFIDLSGNDPTLACLQAMAKAIPDDGHGSIVVYYGAVVRTHLKEMAARQPQWAGIIDGWLNRIVDLHPIVKDHYYAPIMHGSFTIEKVLLAIAPEARSTTSSDIHGQTDAQLDYIAAVFNPEAESIQKFQIETRLLASSMQNTFAMAIITQRLARAMDHNIQAALQRTIESQRHQPLAYANNERWRM